MQIVVKYNGAGVQKWLEAANKLASPAALSSRLAKGLERGGVKVRTQVRKALKAQMNTKRLAPIVADTRSYAEGPLVYTIVGEGSGFRIEEFPVRWSRSKKMMVRWSPREHWKLQVRNGGRFGEIKDEGFDVGGVVAGVWGSDHRFKRSYRAPNGQLRARLPGQKKGFGRLLYGPNVGKEIITGQSLSTFQMMSVQILDQTVARELTKLLP